MRLASKFAKFANRREIFTFKKKFNINIKKQNMTLILNSLKKENAHQNVMRLKVKECSFSSFSVVCKSSWPTNIFFE